MPVWEQLQGKGFRVLKAGSRIALPKDGFLLWMEKRCGGDHDTLVFHRDVSEHACRETATLHIGSTYFLRFACALYIQSLEIFKGVFHF